MSVFPRVLFVGDDWYGSNATSLRNALVHSGCEVQTINTHAYSDPIRHLDRRLWKKTARDSYDRRSARVLERQIEKRVRETRFDVLIAFKALTLTGSVLRSLKFRRIHYHPDDSSNPSHRSVIFDEAEAYYDLHITTKSFNVPEIVARTGRPAIFLWCAYDPEWHRQVSGRADYAVGFIGTRRPDREDLICSVGRAFPGELLISGSGWGRLKALKKSSTVIDGQFGLNFSRTVARAPVQLGLLNSDNRDLHTCRSFEAPAAGALLVAEWTTEHAELFNDGEDALLFRDKSELMDILGRLRRSPQLRDSLISRSHDRITRGSNTYLDRAQEILRHVADL